MASTSSQVGGRCLVCGKAATSRCGKCNAKGMDFMYFCSSEHQKLVWHAHKRVCGKERWVWPTLNQKETSWFRERNEKHGVPQENLDELHKRTTELMEKNIQAGRSVVESEVLAQSYGNTFMSMFRDQIFEFRILESTGRPTTRESLALISQDPLGLMVYFENKYWPGLSVCFPDYTISALHHQLLVFFTILCIHYSDLSLSSRHKPWIEAARHEVSQVLCRFEGEEMAIAPRFGLFMFTEFTEVPGVSPFVPKFLFPQYTQEKTALMPLTPQDILAGN